MGFSPHDDPKLLARAALLSGSYMLYERNLAGPPPVAYAEVWVENLRATIVRPQLTDLDRNVERWNAHYRTMEAGPAGDRCQARGVELKWFGRCPRTTAATTAGAISATCERLQGARVEAAGIANAVDAKTRYPGRY